MKYFKNRISRSLALAVLLSFILITLYLIEFPFDQWPSRAVMIMNLGTWLFLIVMLLVIYQIPAFIHFVFSFGMNAKPIRKYEDYIFKYTLVVRLVSGVFLLLPFGFILVSYIMQLASVDTGFHINIIGGFFTHIIVFLVILFMTNVGLYPLLYKLVLTDKDIRYRDVFYCWRSRSIEGLSSYNKRTGGFDYKLSFANEKPLRVSYHLIGHSALLKLLDAQIEKNKNA
jgi:hypothetical protein